MTAAAPAPFVITSEQRSALERCNRTALYKMLRDQGVVNELYAPVDDVGLVRAPYKPSAMRSVTVTVAAPDAEPEVVTCTSLEAILTRIVPKTMARNLPGFTLKEMHELCLYGAYVDFLPEGVPLMDAAWTGRAIKAAKARAMTPEQVALGYAEWQAADAGEFRGRWERFAAHMGFDLPAKRRRAVEEEHIREAMLEVKSMLQSNPGKRVRLVLEQEAAAGVS